MCAESLDVDFKLASNWKFKDDPAETFLKEYFSIDLLLTCDSFRETFH
jgi:hypothetical protein